MFKQNTRCQLKASLGRMLYPQKRKCPRKPLNSTALFLHENIDALQQNKIPLTQTTSMFAWRENAYCSNNLNYETNNQLTIAKMQPCMHQNKLFAITRGRDPPKHKYAQLQRHFFFITIQSTVVKAIVLKTHVRKHRDLQW